jgi:uncharacterized Zn-binding protein involved in type VI secretion
MGNININGKSAVHAKSEGILTTTDTCMTPPFCIPINYTNIAESKMTDMGASSVKIQDSPACNSKSNFKISKGDGPGCCGGTSSGTTQQLAEFITFSQDVMIEGKPAVRNGDKMVSNNRNTAPQPLVQPPAPNAPANTPAVVDAEYSLRWQALSPETGEPIKDIAYSIIPESGEVVTGKTGEDGNTEQRKDEKPENLKVLLGKGSWSVFMPNTAVSVDREYELAELDEADEELEDNE